VRQLPLRSHATHPSLFPYRLQQRPCLHRSEEQSVCRVHTPPSPARGMRQPTSHELLHSLAASSTFEGQQESPEEQKSLAHPPQDLAQQVRPATMPWSQYGRVQENWLTPLPPHICVSRIGIAHPTSQLSQADETESTPSHAMSRNLCNAADLGICTELMFAFSKGMNICIFCRQDCLDW
jgi:hypothetical protein